MLRAVALILALTIVACSGDDDPPIATPAPPAETTPGPDAFATAVARPVALPVQRVPVRWVPEPSPFDIANAGDPDAPFAARAEELRRRDSTVGPDEWQVGVVEGDAAPRIIYQTHKGLTSLSWTTGLGLQAGMVTERAVPSSLLGVSKAFRWQGSVVIDVRSGQATEKLDPFPDSIGTVVQGSPYAMAVQHAGQSMVVTFSRLPPPPGPPGTPLPGPPVTASIHLIDTQGTSRRLEGLPDAPNLAPLPNGRALVSGPDRAGRVFIVPEQDGEALIVSMVSGIAVERILEPSVGPSSTRVSRIFLAVNAGATGTYAIYDSTTHSLRDIGRGPWPGQGAQGDWTEAGRVRAGSEYIDVTTGRREPIRATPPYPPHPADAPQAYPSPDGRHVIHLTPPARGEPSTRECDGMPLKVDVEQAGTRRSVYECAGGNPATVTWIDNTHALVRSTPCRGGCDDQKGGLLLIDAANARSVPLTQEWVEGPYAHLSPDGTRLLVGGDSLEVRSLDGTVRRRIEAPSQRRLSSAVWSPDGSAFAYLVTPRGWYLVGP